MGELDGKATKPTLYDMMDAYFGESGFGIVSNPPSGKYRIYNIWRNEAGNLEYECDAEPAP